MKTVEANSSKMHRHMDTRLQRFGYNFKALIPWAENKILPPTSIFPFEKDGSLSVIEGVARFGQQVALQRRNCGILPKQMGRGKGVQNPKGYIKLSSPSPELMRLYTTASFSSLCKSRVLWVSPSPTYSVLRVTDACNSHRVTGLGIYLVS